MIVDTYSDLKSLFYSVMKEMLWDRRGARIDARVQPSVYSYDNTLTAEHATMRDFDLGTVGFTRFRWTRFLGQYIDQEALHRWLDQIVETRPGSRIRVAGLAMKPVSTHNWGNCLWAVAFRPSLPAQKVRATLIFYTRTTQLSTTGVIDLALAHALARLVSERLEIPQDDIRFIWYAASIYVSGVFCVPYIASTNSEAVLELDTPLARTIRRVFKKWIWSDEVSKYGPQKRAVNRYHRIKEGRMQKCLVSSLRFPWEETV